MHMHPNFWLRLAAGGCFFAASGAWAADEVAPRTASASIADIANVANVANVGAELPDIAVSELGRTVAVERLSGLRGGDGSVVDNLIDVDGSVDGNTAHHIVSGSNSIADGAFSNASGITTVIQNTGSNVLIQNAMIVTVDFAGGPQ